MSKPPRPQFKNFLISPPVWHEMDEQDPTSPKPIPVIITVVEHSSGPNAGVAHSKESVKAFLKGKATRSRRVTFTYSPAYVRRTSWNSYTKETGYFESGKMKPPNRICSIPPR